MRNVSKWLVVLVVLVVASYTLAAQTTPTPAQQEKAFQGTLVKVDTDAKTITAKDANNKEMMFTYTDNTEVTGSDKTIQGLSGKAGSKLKVTYRAERGANHATRIEVLPD